LRYLLAELEHEALGMARELAERFAEVLKRRLVVVKGVGVGFAVDLPLRQPKSMEHRRFEDTQGFLRARVLLFERPFDCRIVNNHFQVFIASMFRHLFTSLSPPGARWRLDHPHVLQ
jgi:hypothetical protein